MAPLRVLELSVIEDHKDSLAIKKLDGIGPVDNRPSVFHSSRFARKDTTFSTGGLYSMLYSWTTRYLQMQVL